MRGLLSSAIMFRKPGDPRDGRTGIASWAGLMGSAMAGNDQSDRAHLSQDQRKRRPASLSVGHVAAGFSETVVSNPPAEAVIFALQSGNGGSPDKDSHHAPL